MKETASTAASSSAEIHILITTIELIYPQFKPFLCSAQSAAWKDARHLSWKKETLTMLKPLTWIQKHCENTSWFFVLTVGVDSKYTGAPDAAQQKYLSHGQKKGHPAVLQDPFLSVCYWNYQTLVRLSKPPHKCHFFLSMFYLHLCSCQKWRL